MMKWVIIVFAVLVVIVLIVYLRGQSLPIAHAARVEKTFAVSPDSLWRIITDYKTFVSWRRGLKWVEVVDERNWKETSTQGDEIVFQAVTWEPGKKLASRIMNDDLPFGGEWIYEFEQVPEGTHLVITENGEVYNPVFRFISKYVFGHDTTLKNYFEDLDKKLATP